jgi:mannose-6-phosphate isomerase
MNQLPPLTLERKLDSRLWGGQSLGPWLGLSDAPANLAESWQVYEHNRIIDGRFAGQTLAQVVAEHGADVVGTRSFEQYGADFPLLAKFIDAADDLSVQVHPDDTYAHSVEAATGFHGKTEAWHILQASEGAEVIHGFREPATRAECADAIKNGTFNDLLRRVPVRSGDTIFVPAGTVHAINGGILLFEIQQKSDLTYRVFDYNRKDKDGNLRELHVDRALDVLDFTVPETAQIASHTIEPGRELLVRCPYFAMERLTLQAPYGTATEPTSFEIYTTIDGTATLIVGDHTVQLERGQSVVLPASLGEYRIQPEGTATVLRCYVP